MRSILVLLPAFAVTAVAQQVPTKTLARPAAEYDEPFSSLNSLRELKDGRLIVSDIRDKTLQLIDLASGRATPIGREGSGPAEWGLPRRVLAMPGDSTYVFDLLNSRFLVVGPDGRAVRTFSPAAEAAMQTVTRGGGGDGARGGAGVGAGGGRGAAGAGSGSRGGPMRMVASFGGSGLLAARATDARGRLYFTGMPVSLGPDGQLHQADSVPILRQSLGATSPDTVAFVQLATGSAAVSGSQNNMQIRIGGGRPFENGDEWTVFPDGRVAIARVADYRVDIVQPNRQLLRGTPVRYSPVRVTEADKRQWREAQRNTMAFSMSVDGRGSGAPQRSVQTGRPAGAIDEPAEWPEVKSPFPGESVWAAPSGETWVFRSRAANDRIPAADVFDARGRLVGRVVMPAGSRLVALGARGVYAVRIDEDDLQYLQRYALQWENCTPELAENCRAAR